MTLQEDAAREAAVFDGMLPGWHNSYVKGEQWIILLLRREPELVEHLAREVTSRLLFDDFREKMRDVDTYHRRQQ